MNEKKKWELVEGIGLLLLMFGLAGVMNANQYFETSTQWERTVRLILATITGIPGVFMMSYSYWKIRKMKS